MVTTSSSNSAAAQNGRAVGRDANRVAVEHQLVVAADLVDVDEVAAVLDRFLRDEPPPDVGHVQR